MGQSEGAIVAVRVSNLVPFVTHVGALSGGGPVYLFHMGEFFRKKTLIRKRDSFLRSQILKDPESPDPILLGPDLSAMVKLMRTSIAREALASKSALFFGHGVQDEQNPISAFDVLRAELASNGRSAVFDRVEGASHSFDLAGRPAPEGFSLIFNRLLKWFGL